MALCFMVCFWLLVFASVFIELVSVYLTIMLSNQVSFTAWRIRQTRTSMQQLKQQKMYHHQSCIKQSLLNV